MESMGLFATAFTVIESVCGGLFVIGFVRTYLYLSLSKQTITIFEQELY